MSTNNTGFNAGTSEQVNHDCFCSTLDSSALKNRLHQDLIETGLPQSQLPILSESMFAVQPVFVADHHLSNMGQLIRIVDRVTTIPAYQEAILADLPSIARHRDGTQGVLYGYDFHLNKNNLGLIEINTNAGGILLNSALIRAQVACCPEVQAHSYGPHTADRLDQGIVDMFKDEWRAHSIFTGKPDSCLSCIAIIDDHPEQQALYPEFLLFQLLFQRHGIRTIIADRNDLQFKSGRLWIGEDAIDLVYNRCTDFYFQEQASTPLAQAWINNACAVTPNPNHYALHADKQNLIALRNSAWLREIGVEESEITFLNANIPETVMVTKDNGERLWQQRKQWFFKPTTGFGSRAVYRGDKLTRRVWDEIQSRHDYIAQKTIQPGERLNVAHPESGLIKFDLRIYTYLAQGLWTAARLYQGQTTNFRTQGGGFAPVYALPESDSGQTSYIDADPISSLCNCPDESNE